MKQRLDEIIAQLQDSSADIDEATKLYEEGAELVRRMEQYLKTAENKIHKLKQGVQPKK